MKLEGEQLRYDAPLKDVPITWTTKNIQEQRVVATYIAECLEQYASDFSEEGPSTVRAANLVHLRSDFSFTLPDNNHIGDLLLSLHPTPAVCGLPKKSAFDFIVRHEHTPRIRPVVITVGSWACSILRHRPPSMSPSVA